MKKIFLIFGFLLFSQNTFAAVHSVENISEKVKGDRLSLSDVNSILGTIRGFFFDDSTGFVGIGTDEPAANLEISSGNYGDAVLRIEADEDNSDEGDNPRIEFMQDGGINGMKIGLTEYEGSSYNSFAFFHIVGGTESETPALVIEQDRTIQIQGNVGIGTTVPDTKLEVASTNSSQLTLRNTDTTNGTAGYGNLWADNNGLWLQGHGDTSGQSIILNPNGGNVGIGGASPPNAKLEINTDIDVTANPDSKGLRLKESHGDWLLSLGVENVTNQGFAIRDVTQGTYPFVIREETGNVGIGNSSPGAKLEVSNKTGDIGNFLFRANEIRSGDQDGAHHKSFAIAGNGQEIVEIGALSTFVSLEPSLDYFFINTDKTEIAAGTGQYSPDFVIDSSGNVGIGTTDPKAGLHVLTSGSGNSGDGVLIGQDASNGNSKIEIRGSSDGTETPYIDFSNDDTSDYDMRLMLNGDDKLSITGGKVGIGTTEPDVELEVNGDIRVGSIKDEDTESFPSYGAKLFFSGGSDGAQSNSDNTDPLWIARENVAYNESNLVIGLGDDAVGGESFIIRAEPDEEGEKDVFRVNNVGSALLAGALTQNSDSRYKKEIQTLPSALEKVSALRGVSYQWKDRNDESEKIGVIAQEVEKIYPELVHTDEDGYKSVAYSNLVAPLIESVKELNQKITELESEIETLKTSQN